MPTSVRARDPGVLRQNASVDAREVALLRLAAQRLIGPSCTSPLEAVRWMTALQGQDLPGAALSVALRCGARGCEAVRQALDAGTVVRSWPMRGTLHLVAAEDLSWMLTLLAPRADAAARRRRDRLGLDEAALARGAELVVAALEAAPASGLRRRELLDVLAAGCAVQGQAGAHLLTHLATSGLVVLGPVRAGEQLVVLARDWLPSTLPRERDEALAELALRYFSSHGPASVADLARWAMLTRGDARAATDAARPHLEAVVVDGVEMLMDPSTPARLEAAGREADGVLLLPGFDEIVLGYADRSPTLDRAHEVLVVPGGNGVFRATVLAGGRAVATWSRGGRERSALAVEPFTALDPAVEAALPTAFAALPAPWPTASAGRAAPGA